MDYYNYGLSILLINASEDDKKNKKDDASVDDKKNKKDFKAKDNFTRIKVENAYIVGNWLTDIDSTSSSSSCDNDDKDEKVVGLAM